MGYEKKEETDYHLHTRFFLYLEITSLISSGEKNASNSWQSRGVGLTFSVCAHSLFHDASVAITEALTLHCLGA